MKRKTNKPSKIKTKMQKNPLFSSLVISAAVQKVVWIVTKRVKNSPKDYLNIFFLIANSFRVSQSIS